MNIFYLSDHPHLCAEYHCDKHVVKMILETAQMLSTAHHELDGEKAIEGIYRSTHKNHPSNVWVRENYGNYMYAWELLYHLLEQYKIRYKKTHATHRLLDPLSVRPKNISGMPVPTEPPQCMPDEYKVEGDSIQAYRNYYLGEKHFAQWKYTPTPNWWKQKGETA